MSNVLVTGGTGFIGAHLVKRLTDAGESVTCLVRNPSRASFLKPLGVNLAQGDVERPESLVSAVAQADVIYHLAAATTVRRTAEYDLVNRKGTHNIVSAAAKAVNPPVLVYVSSLAAVGAARQPEGAGEADPASPVSAYGRSKLAAERCLAEFAQQVPISIVRPPIVFGPREQHLLSFFKLVRRGWVIVPGSKICRYSVSHVEDLVEALVLAANRGRRLQANEKDAPGVYNIAHPEHSTFPELGSLVGEVFGRTKIRTLRVPLSICWVAAGFQQLMSRFFGRMSFINLDKVREARAGSWTCQTERAERELGFRPAQPLDRRFRETACWYMENGWM